jgi:hypothetical protein
MYALTSTPPQDVFGVHLSDDLKEPARPALVGLLEPECPGKISASNLLYMLWFEKPGAFTDHLVCRAADEMLMSPPCPEGRARLVKVSGADQAKAGNISRVIWTTIEGGVRPWDDLQGIVQNYSRAGATGSSLLSVCDLHRAC